MELLDTMGDSGKPLYEELGLLQSEYERVVSLMGREPTDPELVMFSLMWSEHCSYKHSKPLLKGIGDAVKFIWEGIKATNRILADIAANISPHNGEPRVLELLLHIGPDRPKRSS